MTPWLTESPPQYGVPKTVAPGIRRLVAPNPGPFTQAGTNTWILGTTRLVVVDPGPDEPGHLDAILQSAGAAPVEAILVTHGHADHWPGAVVLGQRLGVPVQGFDGPAPAEGHSSEVPGTTRFCPDRGLAEGDGLRFGDLELEVLHTPGHRFDHLSYAIPSLGVLVTGDHVMGWSSSVVSPPEGDMAAYLRSLRRLRGRTDQLWLPGHGPVIPKPSGFLEAVIAHREAREAAILAALRQGDRTIDAIVARVYAATPVHLHGAAARSVFAHLLALAADGRVTSDPAPSIEARYQPR